MGIPHHPLNLNEPMSTNRLLLPLLISTLFWSACRSPEAPSRNERAANAELLRARALYEDGRLAEAMIATIDIGHKNPNMPGLSQLRAEIMTTMNDRRQRDVERRRDDSMTRTMLESQEGSQVPDTFRLRRGIQGNDSSHIRPRGNMEDQLDQTLSLNFDEVSLRDIITYLGQESQLNIIADAGLETPPVSIHAQEITIRELFDYLSRNLNIEFNAGRNLIWITPGTEPRSATPLYTRIYRLRHGLYNEYLNEDGADASLMTLIEAIERFVSIPDGADLLFDKNSHILLVKNTEKNLAIVDQIVEALDVAPPQVLIEARFVSTSVSDLRELGVDWLLQGNVPLSRTGGQTRTQLNPGATIGFGESLRAGEGFTGTFTGILTDPQFRAVLHALEVKGDARTLSAPKVIAVNNRPAYIRIGRDIAYVSDIRTERESFGTGDNRQDLLIRDPVVDTLETGYELSATVSVGANRRDINLRLRPEIVELIRFREITRTVVDTNRNGNGNGSPQDADELLPVSGIEFPELARSLIETEVVVQSGETVAMGGLMRHREQEDKRGVPILSSLPLIGKLFSRSSVVREQENLLVFVTATLISRRGEDLVPINVFTPDEADTRGRFIENNAPIDESVSD